MNPDDQPVNSQRDIKTLGQSRTDSTQPSADPNVLSLRRTAAHFIDEVDRMTNTSQNPEVKRLAALAMTHAEDAAMWAVKAVTKPDRE